ncbi:hypothetical protein [Desulfoplanes sp.]
MKKQLVILMLLVTLCTACSGLGGAETTTQNPATPDQTEPVNAEEVDSYYDFDDVLVPREMEIDSNKSLVFESPNLKAGMMFFEGRVEPVSLFDFFVNSMPKDGWHSTSSFKYGRYIIGFEKPNKDCIISISDGSFKTGLQIWVNERKGGAPKTMERTLSE